MNHEIDRRIPKVLFKPSFDLMFKLTQANEVVINLPELNISNQSAVLSKNKEGGFMIEIDHMIGDLSRPYAIAILIDQIRYQSEIYFTSKRTKIIRDDNGDNSYHGQFILKGQLYKLDLISNNEIVLYNRFIIASKKRQLDYYIKSEGFKDESSMHRIGSLPIAIDGYTFRLYEKKYEEDFYFIIDSKERMPSEKFSNICHSIMIGFGFLSANFHQDEAFYLSSENQKFNNITNVSYLQLRPSIITNGGYNPIYSNPYGYTKDETLINGLSNGIEVFDATLFSHLCNKIYNEEDYAILILLILEANASSLVLKPAGYAVALEKITNIIVNENKGLKPIPDKKTSKEFREELKRVLNTFSQKIEAIGNEDSLIILQKNIDKINNPTNRDKLTKPFDIYNIVLSQEDLKAIDNRNNFLHGRSIKVEQGRDESM